MLSKIQVTKIKATISGSFKAHASISPARTKQLLPVKNLQGKLYEAHVLSCIIRDLVVQEKCTVKLIATSRTNLMFKQKGSPVKRDYPYFEVHRKGSLFGELFTDTEFSSLSSFILGGSSLKRSDYHELDIVLFKPGCTGRPRYDEVLLAVECKATTIEKSTFRELLGFRRELTKLYSGPKLTKFRHWPAATIQADPASVHMCYSTDSAILNYKANGLVFGIMMVHELM